MRDEGGAGLLRWATGAWRSALRRRASVTLIFAVSTAVGLYFASQVAFAWPEAVRVPWRVALPKNLAHYWAWGAAVPVVAMLGRRFPLASGRRVSDLAVHVLAGAGLTSVQIAIPAIALNWFGIYTDQEYRVRETLAMLEGRSLRRGSCGSTAGPWSTSPRSSRCDRARAMAGRWRSAAGASRSAAGIEPGCAVYARPDEAAWRRYQRRRMAQEHPDR